MKGRVWVKTILQSYNFIARVNRTIDKQVADRSVMSHLFSFGYQDTLSLMESIIDLIERKQNLLKLKELVEDGFNFINPEHAKALMLTYIDEYNIDDISTLLNLSKRTLQRKINKALSEMFYFFNKNGYTIEYIEKKYEQEKWLVGAFNNNIDRMGSNYKNYRIEIENKKEKPSFSFIQSLYMHR